MVMNLSRIFVMLFSSIGHWRDSLLYLFRTANLDSFQAAIKGANNGFLFDCSLFLLKYEQACFLPHATHATPMLIQEKP